MTSRLWILPFALAACTQATAVEHRVDVFEHHFEPAHLTLEVGDTVTWTNRGALAHNVRADDDSFRCADGCGFGGGIDDYYGGGGAGPGSPAAGSWSVTLQFDRPGDLRYYCEVHGAPGGTGMSGLLTVLATQGDGGGFAINYGLSGPWFNPAMPGQGLMIEILPGLDPPVLALGWFTYDTAPGGPEAQRWFTAQGTFEDGAHRVALTVFRSIGGAMAQSAPAAATTPIGTAEIEFESCTRGHFRFDVDLGEMMPRRVVDAFAIERATPDVLCEELARP